MSAPVWGLIAVVVIGGAGIAVALYRFVRGGGK